MQVNKTFKSMVGQQKVKTTLSLYIEAYKATGRIPFLNFTTQKGGGKSFSVRLFREGLERPDGTRPPLLEVNAATIKNPQQFFEQIVPVWTQHKAVLFLDEVQNLPHSLQQIFLSLLDVKKSPIRSVTWEEAEYHFNFNEISFISATTNQEKLTPALRDRLKDISFEEYKPFELMEIFENQLFPEIELTADVKPLIIPCFRGNPRDAVVKAEDVRMFCAAKNLKKLEAQNWKEFCSVMSIHPHGLTSAEMTIMRILGQRHEMSLNGLSAATGFSRTAIQQDYETSLIRKNFLQIEQKRKLSADGIRFYHEFVK